MPDWFDLFKARGLVLATAESCTGGLIAATITDYPGSSALFDRAFITYSNTAKTEMLGVPEDLLAAHGAVSAPVAAAMATGALTRSRADMTLSCTGIAGPDGGRPEKPVGLVYIGLATATASPQTFEHRFTGDRTAIRRQTVEAALTHAKDSLLNATALKEEGLP